MCARQLEERIENGEIICNRKKFAGLVLEIFGIYLSEQADLERSQMRKSLRGISVKVVLFFVLSKVRCEAESNIRELLPVPIEIGVNDGWFFPLVHGIEHFKNVSSDKLVVSIESKGNLILLAVVVGSLIDIFQGGHPVGIDDQRGLVLPNAIEFEVLPHDISASIGWGIVDDNGVIVRVVLVEDRV